MPRCHHISRPVPLLAIPLPLLLLAAWVGCAHAILTVEFRSDLDTDPAYREQLTSAAVGRLQEAVEFLRESSDYRLHPATDPYRFVIGCVPGEDGVVIPACYTFPDSTVRVAPEYVTPLDDGTAERVLHEFITSDVGWEVVLDDCTDQERREVPEIVRSFIRSEIIHELYHDWQNRQSRFPSVEQGKTLLNRNRDSVGTDWRTYLEKQGIEMEQHDRELAEAELQCCQIQILYWDSLYGPEPTHPLALTFRRLMEAAACYYAKLQAR